MGGGPAEEVEGGVQAAVGNETTDDAVNRAAVGLHGLEGVERFVQLPLGGKRAYVRRTGLAGNGMARIAQLLHC